MDDSVMKVRGEFDSLNPYVFLNYIPKVYLLSLVFLIFLIFVPTFLKPPFFP